MTIFSIAITAPLIFAYVSSTEMGSLTGFFTWIYDFLKVMYHEFEEDGYVAWLLPILYILVYIGTVGSWIARHKAIQVYNGALNLKMVEFLPDRVNFFFNRPNYDITCSYEEIKKLNLIINTQIVHTKSGTYIKMSDIELVFTILNNKVLHLKKFSWLPLNIIYSIIDYTRGMEGFSYQFAGAGEIADVKEKIEDYKQRGLKQILATNEENNCKFMSILLFIVGLVIFVSLFDILIECKNEFWIVGFMPFIFIILSFIPDAFLIADKIRERKYGKY